MIRIIPVDVLLVNGTDLTCLHVLYHVIKRLATTVTGASWGRSVIWELTQ